MVEEMLIGRGDGVTIAASNGVRRPPIGPVTDVAGPRVRLAPASGSTSRRPNGPLHLGQADQLGLGLHRTVDWCEAAFEQLRTLTGAGRPRAVAFTV